MYKPAQGIAQNPVIAVGPRVQAPMLTVRDIVELPALGLSVAAGGDSLEREVTWIHVSELSDPTPWLEGGELLVTTGIGIGASAPARRAYLQRLASHGLSGLAFGTGFGHDSVPRPLVDEAERLGFPILVVPYEVPFIAVTKAVATSLGNERLARLEHALVVHEQLSATRNSASAGRRTPRRVYD